MRIDFDFTIVDTGFSWVADNVHAPALGVLNDLPSTVRQPTPKRAFRGMRWELEYACAADMSLSEEYRQCVAVRDRLWAAPDGLRLGAYVLAANRSQLIYAVVAMSCDHRLPK